MTSSEDKSKEDNLAKSYTSLNSFYKCPLKDIIKKGSAENKLINTFYKLMVNYVIDRMEPLLSPQLIKSLSTTSEMEELETVEKNSMVRVIYKCGNTYEGHVSESIPHGAGRLFFDDGATYEGQFNDGLPEGNGMVKWSDSSWYEGEFQRGLRHGRGLHVSSEDGRRWYGGQWANGKRDGYGQTGCDSSDGALNYTGDWVDGRPHGHGEANWPDGTRYIGSWIKGQPHGHGKATWSGNDVYEGDWVDGYMDGTGTYEWNSNPQDYERLILCLCDKYTGRWSKSKKHGQGVFFSAKTSSTIRGCWIDDALDGPCEMILSTGQSPSCSGLVFRHNILFETPKPSPSSLTKIRRLPAPTITSKRRLTVQSEMKTSVFQLPCEPRLHPVITTGNGIEKSNNNGNRPRNLIRSNFRLMTVDEGLTTYDLTCHVRKLVQANKCSENVEFDLNDFKLELESARCAFRQYTNLLKDLYHAYGAFLADGPITYQPLMTRLGLWQMLIDNNLHARLSLSDFDDLLYGNKDYAFHSAHDPFEPIYFWQFAHAVCELASVIFNDTARQTRQGETRSTCGGMMASALHKLFAEHVKTDDISVSYTAAIGGETWMDSRKTITRMYDVYRLMIRSTSSSSLPTVRQLIQLYGPKLVVGDSVLPSRLDSALPTVLDAMYGSRDEQWTDVTNSDSTLIMFECSVDSVVALLSEACPKIVDRNGLLVQVETRLTFAEWFRFVLLCIRHCRCAPKSNIAEGNSHQ